MVEGALVKLYDAAGGPALGVALACVGSLARRELGPRSDIDLVLLHDGRNRADLDALAHHLWYPLWDAKVKLDHAVRTPAECAAVAVAEVSAGVGLLDLRLIAGDAALVTAARSSLLDAWRGNARKRLPELLIAVEERWSSHGDAAYLLEPDLKECRGGFRDLVMLRALAATWLTDRPHTQVAEPYERLLDVRDALHLSAGRTLDRLLASEVDDIAERLGFAEPDDLRRTVSLAARRIGHAVDLTARSARAALPQRRVLSFVRRERRPVYTREDHGLIVHSDEVGLAAGVSAAEPYVGLHAAALAARRGLLLSPVTAENLGRHAPPIGAPWPDEPRTALLALLSSGPALIGVWEALDLAGVIPRWIPEWERLQAQPQHNPLHRHTVDRHSVQTVAEAQPHLTSVERPDILLLACLLHDIGKVPGAGVEHAELGAPVAESVALKVGFGGADAALVARLVRHHLTLAELATRRDHNDPATVESLVAAVDGNLETLRLLRTLTESDSRAAGPAAWSPWRAQLINGLTDRVESHLVAGGRQVESGTAIDLGLSRSAAIGLARSVALDGRPRVRFEPCPGSVELVVATTDRIGLFSETAGLLAVHGLQIRSAALEVIDAVAVNTWRIDSRRVDDLPDPAFLVKELERLGRGDRSMLEPVRRREHRLSRSSADSSGAAVDTPFAQHAHVAVIPEASRTATVVEVRTGDRAGLLYGLGARLSEISVSIRSAHASTLAGQAIDTFYLTEADGQPLSAARATEVAAALTAAAAR